METKAINALPGIAARMANGTHLVSLFEICENQKSISTDKLLSMVEDIENKMKREAGYIMSTYRRVRTADILMRHDEPRRLNVDS